MLRKLLFTTLGLTFFVNCLAQEVPEKTKKFDHYIGLQVNQLIKQIINLNNNNTSIDNPYLLTYSIYSLKHGVGLRVGAGYNYLQLTDKNNPAIRDSKINDFFYRVGIYKRFILSKRFEAGAGLDFTGDYQMDETFTTSKTIIGTQTDSTSATTISKTTSTGGGLQLNISYGFTNHLLIGTEATFYSLLSKEKQHVLVSETFTDSSSPASDFETINSTNLATDKTTFTMTIPIAIYLILKF